MSLNHLTPAELRLTIPADTLGYSNTSELVGEALPWIGQERAEQAARFGLGMEQADYNLFVLGEVGSGRSSLLKQAMLDAAAHRTVPPDLCYLHNFDVPERPHALRLPAGQGHLLRQLMLLMMKSLQTIIPLHLDSEDFKTQYARISKTYKDEEAKAYAALDAYAEARHFTLHRESGHLVFTLRDNKEHVLTENEVLALPKEKRVQITLDEQALRLEIARFLDQTRPMERVMSEALSALQRRIVKPLLEQELQVIRDGLKKQIKDSVKLGAYLEQVEHDVLENLALFKATDIDDDLRQEALKKTLSRYRVM